MEPSEGRPLSYVRLRVTLFCLIGVFFTVGVGQNTADQVAVRGQDLRGAACHLDTVIVAWMALHVYCVGLVLFGNWSLKRANSNHRFMAGRWVTGVRIAGACLLVFADILLLYGILQSWRPSGKVPGM